MSWLKDRFFQVKIEKRYSSNYLINSGVPQGSLLSPNLFNIYISDIPNHEHVKIANFADDLAIFYSHKNYRCITNRLCQYTKLIQRHLQNWKQKININKTEAIIFTKRRKYLNSEFKIRNALHSWKTNLRYLGLKFDRRLTWNPHLKTLAENGRLALKALWPLIGRKSPLEIDYKIILFKNIIRPKLQYGCPLWLQSAAKSNLNLIFRIQNKCLRTIADPPPGINNILIRTALEIEDLEEYLKKICFRFNKKIINHKNPLIREIQEE